MRPLRGAVDLRSIGRGKMNRRSQAVIIAGPNGAGKSTLAPRLLREEFGIHIYVNADDVAREIAGDDLQSAAIEAGRIVHARVEQLREEGADFAIETTLAGRSLRRTVDRLATMCPSTTSGGASHQASAISNTSTGGSLRSGGCTTPACHRASKGRD